MISKSQSKYIQSLGQKKQRDEEGVFIAEGPKLIREILQSKNAEPRQIFALDGWIQENKELVKNIHITAINEDELEKISQLKTPNQVLAVIEKFEMREPMVKGRISLVLDAIRDPGNFGTIIRISDWFGITQIICSTDCADMYNPKVVQATMGSIARVKVFYADLPTWLKQQNEIRVYASMLEGKDVTKMNALKEGLVVIGSEAKGICDEVLQFAHEKITIPKKGEAESLNAAVATGIVLACLV